jgi:hypothetical protein
MNVCYANPIGNNWKFVNSARKKSIPIFFLSQKNQNKTKQNKVIVFKFFYQEAFKGKYFK